MTPNRSHQHCSTENPIRNKPIDYIEAPNYYEGMNDVTKPSRISDLFRERVREEIAKQETTISAVANDAGISFVHLSRVLSGKADVSLPIAEQIADALGIELAELISGKISA